MSESSLPAVPEKEDCKNEYQRESFVSENLGLVHTCAGRFRGKGIEYDDLYQAVCIGLIKAADRFDASRGFCFSTYAVPVIIGEIKRMFRDGGTVKVSRSLRELALKIKRETELLRKAGGREPTVTELAQRLSVSPEQITEAISASAPPVSLTVSRDGQEGMTDIPVDSPDEKITELLSLKSELSRLESTDRELLRLRFFGSKTQSETARCLGMTQVQVSRREKKLLLYLRERLAV